MQVDAAAAKSAAALADKAAALAAADQAAAAQTAEARSQHEARWKEASDKLAALQKQLQVKLFRTHVLLVVNAKMFDLRHDAALSTVCIIVPATGLQFVTLHLLLLASAEDC